MYRFQDDFDMEVEVRDVEWFEEEYTLLHPDTDYGISVPTNDYNFEPSDDPRDSIGRKRTQEMDRLDWQMLRSSQRTARGAYKSNFIVMGAFLKCHVPNKLYCLSCEDTDKGYKSVFGITNVPAKRIPAVVLELTCSSCSGPLDIMLADMENYDKKKFDDKVKIRIDLLDDPIFIAPVIAPRFAIINKLKYCESTET